MAKKNLKISITDEDVAHVASLARLPIDPTRLPVIKKQLIDSLEYVRTVQTLDLDGVPETAQVSGLTNILREDEVDENRMLTQEQALSNAPRSHKGFFVVTAIMEE